MSGNYKDLPQWQALNRIWKAVPQSARESVKDDFRVITDMIKSAAAPEEKSAAPVQAEPAKAAAAPGDAQTGGAPAVRDPVSNFLVGMSVDAKKLALEMLVREGFNLYDHIMDLAEDTKASDAEELFDACVSQMDIEDYQEAALREIIGACLRKLGR